MYLIFELDQSIQYNDETINSCDQLMLKCKKHHAGLFLNYVRSKSLSYYMLPEVMSTSWMFD